LGVALAQTQQWKEANIIWAEARDVVSSIQDTWQKTQALRALVTTLTEFQPWGEARDVINSIQDKEQQAQALRELSGLLASTNKYKQLIHLIQQAWILAETRADAIRLLPLVTGLVVYQPSLGIAFSKSFTWADQFMGGGSTHGMRNELPE
jgi:hypothetical protein